MMFLGAYRMDEHLHDDPALELEEYGITVNAYAPGFIETSMSAYNCFSEPVFAV